MYENSMLSKMSAFQLKVCATVNIILNVAFPRTLAKLLHIVNIVVTMGLT